MNSKDHDDKIISQFSQQAIPFAQNLAHSHQESLELFQKLAQFSGKEIVLDSGCGPGLVSCFLAPFVNEIHGVDLTPAMISLAQKGALEQKISNARFIQGSMLNLPYPENYFDLSLTRFTFHHLKSPIAAFREMIRVTRPGGKIILMDVTPDSDKQTSYNSFEKLRDPSHTQALTCDQLIQLGDEEQISPPQLIRFGLPMKASDLVADSFPESIEKSTLIQMLSEDVNFNRLSFQARWQKEELMVTFPVTVALWEILS